MMKKRLLSLSLAALVLFYSLPFGRAAEEPPANSAEAMVLMDALTGEVLYGESVDTPMLIASTTKILTALVVLENCSCDAVVTVTKESAGVEGSSMYLKAGEKYTVLELLYGMMLVSGNDAASALAVFAAGSEGEFARLMNEKAKALGMNNSSFSNPHGLDAEDHYSSAYDMALLAAEAMQNEQFAKIVSTKNITIQGKTYTNHNKLLWNYEYARGLKTGYTMSAGRTLVSCAEKDGLALICVTLNDKNDWDDHINAYIWAYDNFKRLSYDENSAFSVPVISGTQDTLSLKAERGEPGLVDIDMEVSVTVSLPDFIYAPVEKGENLGSVTVWCGGKPMETLALLADESIPLDESQEISESQKFLKRIQIKLQQIGK